MELYDGVSGCSDLKDFYGGWNFATGTRSLEVFKGGRCTFFTGLQCQGKSITLGTKDMLQYMDTLPEDLDRKIVSYQCFAF